MAIDFNPAALDAFRNVQFTDNQGIANIEQGTGNIRQVGSYKGFFFARFRSRNESKANNAVRTELLRSLGQAFGIEGMQESNGKVTFSQQFMVKLEQILGKETFKREDFGVKPDGTVSSGKPLTSRRITAILNRATLAGKTEFDLSLYEAKLTDIQAKIDKMPPGREKTNAMKHFEEVRKIVDFLKTEIDGFITKNDAYEFLAQMKDFDQIQREGYTPWEMQNAITGQTEKLNENQVGPAITYLQNRTGQLFHLELNAKRPELVTNYVRNEMESFVKLSIDIFNDSIQAGKFDTFLNHLASTGACMEDKTKKLIEFQEKHGLKESVPVVASEPQIAIDRVATHDKTTKLSDCIFQEIDVVDAKNQAKGAGEFSTWAEYAKPIKEALVGLERPLVTASKNAKNEWEFKPVLDINDQPVIKKLTAEDIDQIGPACVAFVTEY